MLYSAHSLISYIEANDNNSSLSFQDSNLLTFNISAHRSWWSEHGPGCISSEERVADTQSYIQIMGCLLEYQYIEVLHCGFQILTSVSRSKTQYSYAKACRKAKTLNKHSLNSPKPKFYYGLYGLH